MGCNQSFVHSKSPYHLPDSIKVSPHSNQPLVRRDNFLFTRILGEGGFGVVTAAQAVLKSDDGSSISHWFAVKEIKKEDLRHHKTGVVMLFGELQALKRLQNPYIVGLHFAFNDKESCFLVLDLLNGGDLRHHLKESRVLQESQVKFIALCLSSALEYMHSKFVLHRDIKPENILLDRYGYPYLTDFGVAYVHTDQSQVANVKTNPFYRITLARCSSYSHHCCRNFYATHRVELSSILLQRFSPNRMPMDLLLIIGV